MPYTWNPSDKAVGLTLSNNNLTVDHDTADGSKGLRTVDSKNGGKWYYEFNLDTLTANSFVIGWADASHSLLVKVGDDASNIGIGYHTALGRVYKNGSYVTLGCTGAVQGSYMQVAFDLDTGKIWFGFDGVWCASGDPGAGTNWSSQISTAVGVDMFPAVSLYSTDQSGTIRLSTSEFEGTIPSGFSELGEKTISGVVTEAGTPVERTVRAYHRLTGALLDSTTSDSVTGEYTFTIVGSTEVFVIAFDDAAGTDYNAVILDKITPS